MFLEEITGQLNLESRDYECKARLDHNNSAGWLKTVAGFANSSGGLLYIGVEDKTGKLIGFTRAESDIERNYFNNQVNEHIFPRPPYKIEFLRYTVHEKERFIIQIKVEESPVKPIILKYNNVPSIYMRREGFTGGATYEEIIQMSIHSQKAEFDTLISDMDYQRKDFTHLLQFHKDHAGGKALTDKALASLGFFDSNRKLANGSVLFRDNYSGGKTDIQCSVFSGLTKGSERIITVNRFSGSITDSIEFAMDFVRQRMNHTIVKQGTSHIDISAFPERALFEGIINSIAHRDYFLDGTQIQIDMFLDRLEISSPGSFFQGTALGKTYDLSGIISKRRNELICGILVHCNVMEAAGTGFDKIAEDYKDADEAHKPFNNSATDHLTLVLPDLTYMNGVNDSSLPEIEFVPVPGGTAHAKEILSYCYFTARTAADIAAFLGISNSTYLRRNILDNLTANGYLITSKQSRTVYYKTNREQVRKE